MPNSPDERERRSNSKQILQATKPLKGGYTPLTGAADTAVIMFNNHIDPNSFSQLAMFSCPQAVVKHMHLYACLLRASGRHQSMPSQVSQSLRSKNAIATQKLHMEKARTTLTFHSKLHLIIHICTYNIIHRLCHIHLSTHQY